MTIRATLNLMDYLLHLPACVRRRLSPTHSCTVQQFGIVTSHNFQLVFFKYRIIIVLIERIRKFRRENIITVTKTVAHSQTFYFILKTSRVEYICQKKFSSLCVILVLYKPLKLFLLPHI